MHGIGTERSEKCLEYENVPSACCLYSFSQLWFLCDVQKLRHLLRGEAQSGWESTVHPHGANKTPGPKITVHSYFSKHFLVRLYYTKLKELQKLVKLIITLQNIALLKSFLFSFCFIRIFSPLYFNTNYPDGLLHFTKKIEGIYQ